MPIHTEPMTVNIGPQHPSTHGVFRLRVTFDGEEILEVEPIFGYLHRGTEKLAEERNYTQIVTLTDRLDYVSSMINNQAYCLAVEELLGVEVPAQSGQTPQRDDVIDTDAAQQSGWTPTPNLIPILDLQSTVPQRH